jgi:hypothetical protein
MHFFNKLLPHKKDLHHRQRKHTMLRTNLLPTLKIEGEAYGKGVGENDLLIIANAKR